MLVGKRTLKIETADDIVKALKGEQGPQGVQGEQGEKGEKGDTGAQGATGLQGIAGEKGEIGAQGAQGIQGPKGEDGKDGLPGIKGEKGDKGDTGTQGIQGEKGDKGNTGTQGIQGEKGDKGDKGEAGLDGQDGLNGKDGKDGLNGRDAPFSNWVKIEDVVATTSSDVPMIVYLIAEPPQGLFTVKVYGIAKAQEVNASFVAEKLYIINSDKKSINTRTIIPEERTHEAFSFEMKFIDNKALGLFVSSFSGVVDWKLKLEIAAI